MKNNKKYQNLILLITMGILSACNQNKITSTLGITKIVEPDIIAPIAQRIESNITQNSPVCAESILCKSNYITGIYESRNYEPIWIESNGHLRANTESIIAILHNSYQDGLNPNTYHVSLLESMLQQIKTNDAVKKDNPELLANLDLTLSDAYLLYAKDMQNGVINPVQMYPDWGVDRTTVDTKSQFESAIIANTLLPTIEQMPPNNSQYHKLRDVLISYYQKSASVVESSVDSDGNTNSQDTMIMKKIALNMDRLRWLPHNLAESYIMVNIPQFALNVYTDNGESNPLSMNVIVGSGGNHKTCLVTSDINSVIFNPYWGIPRSIATKEYLHKLQDDPYYLADRNIRIYSGNKEIDPESVDWNAVNTKNFKYFFRQDPGVKNALGKVKFVFANTCGIYLHDTANRNLFGRDNRNMSHGCVRIGKPLELANYLLVDREQNSTTRINKILDSGKLGGLKLKQGMPLYITYQTLVVSESGELSNYKDIYSIDNVKYPLYINNN